MSGAGDRPVVTHAGEHMRAFFAELWVDGDPWALETSELDQRRYDRQIELIADRRYTRVLEIGCAAGAFTRRLAPLTDQVLALDIAAEAIAAAKAQAPPNVDHRVANVMELDPVEEGTFDLAVMTETAYYLGWLYPLYDLAWFAHRLYEATLPGGRLLLVNSYGHNESSIMSPPLIDTYRDLFVNTGYGVEHEETMVGEKDTVTFEILLTLLEKPSS